MTEDVKSRLVLPSGQQISLRHAACRGLARGRVLLIHGNPGTRHDWHRVWPLLEDVADVVAVDLPGFGESDPAPRADLTLRGLARSVLAIADALGWREPFVLAGHSHGGGVAQYVASQRPERVCGLALLATLGAAPHLSYRLLALPGADVVGGLASRLFEVDGARALKRSLLRLSMRPIFHPEAVPERFVEHELELLGRNPGILRSMVRVTQGRPCRQLRRGASKIRCPVRIVHGAADALVPPASARLVHEQVRNAAGVSHFLQVAGAGHMLLEYQPAVVADAIIQLLPPESRASFRDVAAGGGRPVSPPSWAASS